MKRNDFILWFGRIATVLFTIGIIYDVYADQRLSAELRLVVIGVAGMVAASIFGWQAYIAYKYDGAPFIPFSFRWVVATWFGALTLFIAWMIAINYLPEIYTDRRSAVVWWQFGSATLWFASRWITVETPHTAGIGETGSTPSRGPGGPTV